MIFFKGGLSKLRLAKLVEVRNRKGLSLLSFGYRLEAYRYYLGLKTELMAERVGVSQGSYSEMSRDLSRPSFNTIVKIISNKNSPIDVKWLLSGE